MKAKVFSSDGKALSEMDLPASVFEVEIKDAVLHEVVVGYQRNLRQGTSKTKGRSEVSGGGKKPWKQKGTGRARAGSNTSPIWVRGGKAFGPTPRDYYNTIPKTLRRIALTSALTSRAGDSKVIVIDGIKIAEAKTKLMSTLLKAIAVDGKRNLLIIDKGQKTIYMSGRNIPNLDIIPVSEITAFDVVQNENIIFGSQDLVKKVEEAVTQ